MTERTLFRHFTDKREVLFGGEIALTAVLTQAVSQASPSLGAWATLLEAFGAAEPLLVGNRDLAAQRRRVIAGSAPLRERELAKTMSLTADLASALRTRGVPAGRASLAAQIGMAAFGQAFESWLDGQPGDFGQHLTNAFHEARELTL